MVSEMDRNSHLNLCSACEAALSNPVTEWYNGDDPKIRIAEIRRVTYETYLQSARAGCRICRISRDTAPQYQLDLFRILGESINYKFHRPVGDMYPRMLEIGPTRFCLLPIDSSADSAPLLCDRTSPQMAQEFVCERLKACLHKHMKCRELRSTASGLPTRLIDVGQDDGQITRAPRLIETKGLNSRTEYFTLSHLWGSSNVVRLLQENFRAFHHEIRLTNLSQTFQDAIRFTRDLGYQYLWIDSLCIIQDFKTDWARESASMSNIFKGGTCNIAATAAAEGSDGLYAIRDPVAISPFNVYVGLNESDQEYLCLRRQARYTGFVKAKLNRRGWVFQERVLSSRTVHFSDQLYWECREVEVAESYPMDLGQEYRYIMDNEDDEYGWRTSLELVDKARIVDMKINPGSGYYAWHVIVESFMNCDLTYARDKLVALSGLASELQFITGGVYLAGLWKDNLVCDLMWWIELASKIDEQPSSRPQLYRAPSWSWASMEGRTTWDAASGVKKPLITVLEAKVVLSTANPYGEVSGGFIRVSGNPKRVSGAELGQEVDKLSAPGVATSICWDTDDARIRHGEELMVLPVISCIKTASLDDGRQTAVCEFLGLVLEPTNIKPHEFHRLGLLAQQSSSISKFLAGLEWDFQKNDWCSNEGRDAAFAEIILV